METKRKLEEVERKRQEEEDLRAAVALQVVRLNFKFGKFFGFDVSQFLGPTGKRST